MIGLAVIIASFSAAFTVPFAHARHVSPAFFGQHLMFNSALDPRFPVHAMRLWDSNTKWCEMDAGPGPQQYRFGQFYAVLNQASRVRADVEFTFGGTPRWARADRSAPLATGDQCRATLTSSPSTPPADEASWKSFVTAVVTRAKGRIGAYELWNEANYPYYWSGTTEQMVRMSADAAAIIHRVDPSAIVLSPSITATPDGYAFLRNYLARLPRGAVDAIAVHTYTEGVWPETAVPGAIARVRAALPAAYASTPIWATEGGWGSNRRLPEIGASASTASAQMAFVARYDLLLLTAGVRRSYWYAYKNSQWGTLFDGSALTPAGVAMRTVEAWLSGATLAGCTTVDGNLWSCDVTTRAGRTGRIVWATRRAAWYPTAGYATVSTLDGRSSSARPSIQVTYEPVLLTSRGAHRRRQRHGRHEHAGGRRRSRGRGRHAFRARVR